METSPSNDTFTEAPTCWLCLCGVEAGPLTLPCKCPSMYSHPFCLGRWQLQQAGREEERSCRFCHSTLQSWTASLLDDPSAQLSTAVPIMAVVFNGRMVKLPCIPGKEGAELFKKQIREIFHLDESVSLDVTFELKVPAHEESTSGQKVYLKGFHTFEAASTVAAICAAKRMARSCGGPSTSSGVRSISGAPGPSRVPTEPQFASTSVPFLSPRPDMERSPSGLPSADSPAASFSNGEEYRRDSLAQQQQYQQEQQQRAQELNGSSRKKTVGGEIVRKFKTLFGIRSSSSSSSGVAVA